MVCSELTRSFPIANFSHFGVFKNESRIGERIVAVVQHEKHICQEGRERVGSIESFGALRHATLLEQFCSCGLVGINEKLLLIHISGPISGSLSSVLPKLFVQHLISCFLHSWRFFCRCFPRLLFFLPFPGCGLRLTFRRIVGRSDWSNIVLHFGSGVRIFCRFLLCGGGAWLCPRRLWMRLLVFFRLRKKARTRYNWSRRLRSPRSRRTRRPRGLWRPTTSKPYTRRYIRVRA